MSVEKVLFLTAVVAIAAYFWPREQPVEENDTFCKNLDGFELEICQLYNKCVIPLEISYKFQSFRSLGGRPPLSKSYFSPHKPLILLVGPYSTGNVVFMTSPTCSLQSGAFLNDNSIM
jgi:hypothetical protein